MGVVTDGKHGNSIVSTNKPGTRYPEPRVRTVVSTLREFEFGVLFNAPLHSLNVLFTLDLYASTKSFISIYLTTYLSSLTNPTTNGGRPSIAEGKDGRTELGEGVFLLHNQALGA